MVPIVCCDAEERGSCGDTVVHIFNMVAVLHCLWDTLCATQYHAAGDSAEDYEAAMWINRLIWPNSNVQWATRVSFSVLQIVMPRRRQYTIVWVQKIMSALNYVRSNHLSLSKETASAVKSVSFQRAGNVCSDSWRTTQPLFSRKVLRQANVIAEYRGKHRPNPPVHLLMLPAGALVEGAELHSANCAIK